MPRNAVDVAAAVRQLAPGAKAVIGMSLGVLTAIALSAEAPELVRKIILPTKVRSPAVRGGDVLLRGARCKGLMAWPVP